MDTTLIATTDGKTNGRREATRFGIAVGLLCLSITFLASLLGHREGNDYTTFGTLWASGHAAINGLNPYAGYAETYQNDYSQFGTTATFPDVNLNPPWTLPLIEGLSRFSLKRFTLVWTLLNGACFFASCILLIVQYPQLEGRQVIWFSLCTPTIMTLASGQVYGWGFLAAVLAWMFHRDGRLAAAGVAAGFLIALRPTMVPWLILLVLANHRKVAAVAAATIFTLYLLPLAIYGPAVYVEWFHAFQGDLHWLHPLDIAFMPLFARYHLPHLGMALAVLFGVTGCWWAVRKTPDFSTTSGVALCLGILCAPLAWFHYILFPAPFFMTRRWTALSATGACLFLIITLFIPAGIQGVVYLVGTVLILCSFLSFRHADFALRNSASDASTTV